MVGLGRGSHSMHQQSTDATGQVAALGADHALPSKSLRACSHLCLKSHWNQNTHGAGLGRCHHTRPDASFHVGTDSHTESRQMGVGSKLAAQPAQSPKRDAQSWETKGKVSVIPHTGMLVL